MSEHDAKFDHPRIPPPGGNGESLREYGRQLAIDSLLEMLLKGTEEVVGEDQDRGKTSLRQPPRSPLPRRPRALKDRTRVWMTAAAAAVLVLLLIGGHFLLRPNRPVPETQGPVVALTAPWSIEPTGAAEFRVLSPTRIQLDRGELRLACRAESLQAKGVVKPPELIIVTPFGTATAGGDDISPHEIDFFIGTHQLQAALQGASMFSRLTRVLVLTGTVTLANALGSTSGGPDNLLAAEQEKKPVNLAVAANSDFGLDLYRQLAKAAPGKNLFFSPYSMSSALAMAAEGARGATAEEMGKALHFPAAARRIGDDAQLLPWNTAFIHTGMAELTRQFNDQDKKASPAIVKQVAELRKQLAKINRRWNELGNPGSVFNNDDPKTAEETRKLVEQGHKTATELNTLLEQVDRCELRVVNGLWGAKEYPFRPEFLNTLGTHYAIGGVAPLDFRGDPEGARQKINAWCKEQTNGRIDDALPQGSIDDKTRLVLANAIYFLARWANPFDAELTRDADFTLTGKDRARVSMMHKPADWTPYAAFNGDGSFFETPDGYDPAKKDETKLYPGERGFLMAEFPYKGDQLAMTVLLPRSLGGLANLERLLTPDNLREWVGRLKSNEVDVFLPRFKLNTAYQMNDPLKALGMDRAFEMSKADFRGISTADEPLWLTGVFHKAFVEVNEKGTEAAAFTGNVAGGAPNNEDWKPFVPEFKADRPFIFLIRDCKTGTILFLGRIEDPRS
jgi:serine protease inhibitor